MKRTRLLYVAIVCIIVTLSLVQIAVSNMLSTGGITLGNIQDQIHSYQRENSILKEKILTLSSFTTVSEEAQKAGFVEDKTNTLVIANTQPLAIKQ